MMVRAFKGGSALSETVTYRVASMQCGHCKAAVENELLDLAEVDAAEADLESNVVTISGRGLNEERLRQAIEDAGYEAA